MESLTSNVDIISMNQFEYISKKITNNFISFVPFLLHLDLFQEMLFKKKLGV